MLAAVPMTEANPFALVVDDEQQIHRSCARPSSLAALLRAYRVAEVEGDRYASEWPAERLRAHHITYVPAEESKSDLYRDLLPVHRIDLLDVPRLSAQSCAFSSDAR